VHFSLLKFHVHPGKAQQPVVALILLHLILSVNCGLHLVVFLYLHPLFLHREDCPSYWPQKMFSSAGTLKGSTPAQESSGKAEQVPELHWHVPEKILHQLFGLPSQVKAVGGEVGKLVGGDVGMPVGGDV